jgi:hypothetical protein
MVVSICETASAALKRMVRAALQAVQYSEYNPEVLFRKPDKSDKGKGGREIRKQKKAFGCSG